VRLGFDLQVALFSVLAVVVPQRPLDVDRVGIVSLVKERDFDHIRADLLATIPEEFSIETDLRVDEESLRKAVRSWMIALGRSPIRVA
jgi:hypothetical protein